MCNIYDPSELDRINELFMTAAEGFTYPRQAYKNYEAPMVHVNDHGQRECVLARFGVISNRGPDKKPIIVTNARSETVGEKRTFSGDWRAGRLCLVPASSIYEPNYEADPDKSVRYRIWLKDQADFAIAGVWQMYQHEGEPPRYRFTMLTMNADHHAVFRRMHAPKDEKRGVVMLHQDQWDDWLECRDPERARTFLKLYPAELMDCGAAPAPPRKKESARPVDDLFGGQPD